MLIRRTFLGLAAALTLSASAHARDEAASAAAPSASAAASTNPRVRIETPEGAIVLELYADKAPKTVANYLKYVDRNLFDGASFYRASKPPGYAPNDYGVIQGGLQNDPKKVLPPVAHEPTTQTGVKHVNGTISMGRHAPGTAQADWFIVIGDQDYLDADPKDPKKTPGFAAFGRVVEGLDVAQKILGMPVDPKAGVGAMKGEMLVKPVRITRVRRVTP